MPPDKRKIMLIEDDRFLSTVIKARLEKSGFAVVQTFDGEEALRVLPEEKPDLIVLDLIMPKITGFEVLKSVSSHKEFKKIPIIVLSHLAQASDIEKAKSLGAVEYFVKVKVSIDDLVDKVKLLMG